MQIQLKNGPEPVYIQIERQLEVAIKSGDLEHGSQLATEGELARELSVSRLTVRKAYTNLKKRGLIQSLKAKGTFVLYQKSDVANCTADSELRTIGIVLPAEESTYRGRLPHDYVQLGVLRGVMERCAELGLRSELLHLPLAKGSSCCAEQIMKHTQGAVFIIDPVYKDVMKQLAECHFPYVLAYGAVYDDELFRIYPDQQKAAYEAVEYLVSLGHRNIALINGKPRRHWGYQMKSDGYNEAMINNKLPRRKYLTELNDVSVDTVEQAMEALLALPQPPTAIVAATDIVLQGVMKATAQQAVAVPDELSVIGFDAGVAGQQYPLKITSMDTDFAAIGAGAVNGLLQNGKEIANPVTIKMTYGKSISTTIS